jgi:hypothetical protein
MSDPDAPEGQGLVPVSDDGAPGADEWPPQVQLVATFLGFLDSDRPDYVLRQLVTPESLASWRRDLDEVAEMLEDLGLATGVEFAHDERHQVVSDVAYVRFVRTPDADQTYKVDADVLAPAQIVTVQHRPELGSSFDGWRIHGIGDYLRPEQLSRRP